MSPADVAASAPIPLPTLLSHALVALTIEMDNEYELAMPHFTTNSLKRGEPAAGPWLTSFVMWANFLRFVEPPGTAKAALQTRSRISAGELHIAVGGMHRWGYLTVDREVLRLNAAGIRAQAIWATLPPLVESRWRQRFGAPAIAALGSVLERVRSGVDDGTLPAYLPVARYQTGLRVEIGGAPAPEHERDLADVGLATLLAKVLLAFTIEFERQSEISLALSANIVRVLDAGGVAVRDLPMLTGASKEAIAFSLGLEKSGHLAVSTVGRTKVASLTSTGLAARAHYEELIAAIEADWIRRHGADVTELRQRLESIVVTTDRASSPLAAGLDAPDQCWRASMKPPATLPHHPLVLHRGGYPDGS